MDNQERQSARETGGRSLLTRAAALVLALLVVLGAVSMLLLADSRHLDRIRRWLVYGESTQENLYTFAADNRNRFGLAGDCLVVLSQNSIQFLDNDGTARFSQQVQLSRPALHVEGELAVAYDIGGQNLYLFSAAGEQLHLTLEEDWGFLSARLSAKGYLAVISEQSGYKGVVDVYDSRQEQVFTYNSSSRFLIDAAVSADSTCVSIVALGEAEGSFSSQVLRYPLDQQEPSAQTNLKDHLTMDLASMGEQLVSISDTDICFLDADGRLTGSFFYDSLYLRRYSLGGEDFAALLLNRYHSGSIGTLMTVDAAGSLVAAKDVTEEVLDISAAGDYVAVLYGDTLVIYDRALQEYARLSGTGYASRVLMNGDGSAIVIGGNYAWRYLP